MSKQGMKRIDQAKQKPHNDLPPVPQISGKAKSGKEKANPIVAETAAPHQKVWHTASDTVDRPIASVYRAVDNDLARDNLENDIPEADLQDL